MYNPLKYALLTSLCIISLSHAEENHTSTSLSAISANPVRSSLFFEYHNRMAVFNPIHLVYERIKPHAFYIGIEGWIAPTWSHCSYPSKKEHVRDLKDFKGICGVWEAEFRVGYNFYYNQRDHLTPLVGIGLISQLSNIAYGTFGLLYDHEFNSIFTLGFNVKGLTGTSITGHKDEKGLYLGTDMALPITLRFGPKRHWDWRIEPFDIYILGPNSKGNCFGFRGTLGYRF